MTVPSPTPTPASASLAGAITVSAGAPAPKVYRTMFEDGGKPRVGSSWSELGVRPPGTQSVPDIDLDAQGNVLLNKKGMSVFSSLADLKYLPARLVPMHLWQKVRGAGGAPAKGHPSGMRIWSLGSGPFASGNLATGLALDAPGGRHGTVCPAQAMPLAGFQTALADTQDSWKIDEPS